MTTKHLVVAIAGTLLGLAVVKALADKYTPGLTPAGLVSKLPASTVAVTK